MKMNDQEIAALVREAEEKLAPHFARLEDISAKRTREVLDAFREERVSAALFAPTDGYGYDDRGRDTLDRIYARVFGCPSAFVRHSIASGTHALTIGLFGLLRPGDILLSATGKPYDTLDEVIGLQGEAGRGSLADFGVEYKQVDLLPNGDIDLPAVISLCRTYGRRVRVVFFQRSKGYLARKTLTVAKLGQAFSALRPVTDAFFAVDNCYGEFVEETEPTAVGADLCIGSLIKNPGGGMAESGGYLAGTPRAVELCGYRMTAVGVGLEIGATLGNTKSMYKGLFYAPHTVKEALKTAHLAAYLFGAVGYKTEPSWDEVRADIIQAVECGTPEGLIAFCRGIQAGSPVDAFVSCEPWAMPGYQDEVIMAAGTFTQGSSLELSADGPIRPPYTAFFQGGLTYESGKIGVVSALRAVLASKEG